MMRKNTYTKYFFRSLKKELSRILSIIAIVALGVGFLIGLLSSTPDLHKTVNSYIKDYMINDLSIRSSVGFSEETIEYLHDNINDLDQMTIKSELEVEGKQDENAYYFRLIYEMMDESSINKLALQEGRFPENENECVILSGNSTLNSFAIGDSLFFSDGEKTISYQIVGKVYDPMYLSKEAIYSYDSVKTIQSVVYLDLRYNDNFLNPGVITEVCFTFESLKRKDVFSTTYRREIKEKMTEIETLLADNQLHESNYKDLLEKTIRDEIKARLLSLGMNEMQAEEIMKTEQIINEINQAVESQFTASFEETNPTFYVLSQQEISSLYEFSVNAEKVELIASIFPVFFFAIAMLVCLSSFSRIVSKDQLEIGTFKALGYENRQIYKKYLLIGLFSVLIGCILGVSGGIFLLPYIIYKTYTPLYQLPPISFTFQYTYVFGVCILMLALNLLVVYSVVARYVKKNTATLINDETIKPGRTILLEKIPFIWKKLKFKTKSMFRNIFRFKKNLWMMILGVGGCSAILLTSFGLDNSLNVLTTNQYEHIFKYNLIIETTEEQINDLDESMQILYLENGTINDDREYKTSLIGGDDQLNQFITFTDLKGKTLTFTSDSCFITRQVAKELKLKKNDSIIFHYQQKQFSFTITDIVENYVGNYLYLGENILSTLPMTSLNALIAYKDFSAIDEDAWFDFLKEQDQIKNVIYTKQYFETYSTLMDNLMGVVAILICISGLLAIIVIYNLVDININERMKEMATLRVLGYQKREVIMYIFREVLLMSVFGFIVGIILGIFLHQFIISSIATPGLIFGKHIKALSYLYTGLLTILFSLVVVIIFSPKIAKIHMAEALKAKD